MLVPVRHGLARPGTQNSARNTSTRRERVSSNGASINRNVLAIVISEEEVVGSELFPIDVVIL